MSPDDGAVKAINKAFYRNVDFPIRAFIVPDSLRASKPEAYFPQVVGFGPLHHSRLQLDANDFGIAYIMAIDGQFLFVLLLHFGIRNESSDGKLQKIDTSNVLALSPLEVLEDYPAFIALKHAHLLELLYRLIVLTEPPQEDARKGAAPMAGIEFVEILIPTASKLCAVGVQLVCTNHVTAIEFEVEGDPVSFKLPFIKLNAYIEVIIRNLEAFEQISELESEFLVLTRYFEMMNAIIETKEDVKLLKDHGILERGSMKDEEVVKIFSGMSKPVRLANPPNIDKAIEEANKYYNGQLEVMTLKFIKKCLRPLWNIIRKIWTAILLFIMAFQVYCSVYGCARNCKKSN
ncbi:putative UPF0481 protein At3g02645 [Fagus crenata]